MFRFVVASAVLAVVALAQQGDDLPPFLVGQPPAVAQSFFAVIQANNGKPEAAVNAAVDTWASKQSAAIKTKYTEFKANISKYQKEEEDAHAKAVSKFTPEARAADEKLSKIAAAPGSFESKQAQIKSVIDSLPPAVKSEILAAMGGPQ